MAQCCGLRGSEGVRHPLVWPIGVQTAMPVPPPGLRPSTPLRNATGPQCPASLRPCVAGRATATTRRSGTGRPRHSAMARRSPGASGAPPPPRLLPPFSPPSVRRVRWGPGRSRAVLKNPIFFWLRTALKHSPKGPPTAKRRQPPTSVQHCFGGIVSCPCLDPEAESVVVTVHFCSRYTAPPPPLIFPEGQPRAGLLCMALPLFFFFCLSVH